MIAGSPTFAGLVGLVGLVGQGATRRGKRRRPAPAAGGGRSGRGSLLVLFVLVATLSFAWVPVSAVAAEPESWGYDLSHDLMSPFCPGRTLATCPSPQAAELVQWIVMQEAAGASQEQVVEMLIERYGEEILAAPPAEGITLWAYVLPALGFLVGGGLAFVVLRRIVASGPVVSSPGSIVEGGTEMRASASDTTPGSTSDSTSGSTGAPGGHQPEDVREASHGAAALRKDEDDDLARIVDADLDRRSA